MEKTQKRLLGLFGLGLVAATTVFAAAMPSPMTLATSTVTDNIQVRVVSSDVFINIFSPTDGAELINGSQTLEYEHGNAKNINITLEYTGMDGVTHTYILADFPTTGEVKTETMPLNLKDYGFGEYRLTITGKDAEGTPASSTTIEFAYYPVKADAKQEPNSSNVDVNLDYDTSDPEIAGVVINVYDENGNPVDGMTETVTPPSTGTTLDFSKLGDGTYTIVATAVDADGNPLYEVYRTTLNYKAPSIGPVVPVPNTADTGGLFQNTNISNADYLITGLLVFGIIAIVGIGFAMRNGKKNNKNQRRK
ncbi:hypothetical protein IKF21_00170 [Candidatus Saccharibacteria bacterium]|nr:hypothetical protein [Candidatus Saccharibacteria bacterium]